jgi:hypothetical protein
MVFTGDRYGLQAAACKKDDASCYESGRYSLNDERTEMTLTRAAGGSTRYPFVVRELETEPASSSIASKALTESGSEPLLSRRVHAFELGTSSGPVPLIVAEWSVDQCHGGCSPTFKPGCRPATYSACPMVLYSYCCDS